MADVVIPDGTTKALSDFKTEFARTLLVGWADEQVRTGGFLCPHAQRVYLDFAIEKGWVSKKEPHRVSAKGYSTAAAFLRR